MMRYHIGCRHYLVLFMDLVLIPWAEVARRSFSKKSACHADISILFCSYLTSYSTAISLLCGKKLENWRGSGPFRENIGAWREGKVFLVLNRDLLTCKIKWNSSNMYQENFCWNLKGNRKKGQKRTWKTLVNKFQNLKKICE